MTKNNFWFHRIKNHKVSVVKVLVCLALIILVTSFALIQGFAYELPVAGGEAGSLINTGGFLTATYLGYVRSIANYQLECGSFNSGQIVAVYYNTANEIRMTVSAPEFDIRYTLTAGIFEASSGTSCVRYRLSTGGFELYYSASAPSVTEENMIMYRDANGNLVNNPSVVTGSAEPAQLLAPYSAWLTAVNAQVGGNTQNAYNEGYQDGYAEGQEVGYTEGHQVGYQEGFDYGYDKGYGVGFIDGGQGSGSGSGGVIITEEIDIGSIISSLPQAARNIIDGAFGFTIFGINVAGTLTAILAVVIVGVVIKWLMSFKG